MSNSKLVRVLATLSKDEWQSLRRYLRVYNREESDHFKLFDKISKKQKEVDASFDLAKIKAKNFSKYNNKAFGSLQSRLYKEVCEWLAIEQFKQRKYTQELSLLKAFNNRGLYKDADSVAKKLDRIIYAIPELDLEKTVAVQKMYHYQYYSDNPIKYREGTNLLSEIINSSLLYFKRQSILYLTETFNWGEITNADYDSEKELLKKLIKIIPSDEIELLYLNHLVEKQDLASLKMLKASLLSGSFVAGSELHTLITMYLIRYSLELWISGKLNDENIILDLYEYGLNTEVLMKSGKIPLVRFYNILGTLGNIKDFNWTSRFIKKWITHVNTNSIGSTTALANAYNSFYHQKFDKIIDYLNNVHFEYEGQKVRALGLQSIALFEAGDRHYDVLIVHLENFKRSLKRNKNKISSKLFLRHWNLLDFIDCLLKSNVKKSIIDIGAYHDLIYRDWCKMKLGLNNR